MNAKDSSSSNGASPGDRGFVDSKTTESPERTDFTLAILADIVKWSLTKDSYRAVVYKVNKQMQPELQSLLCSIDEKLTQ